eukprot:sb/3466955/
MDSHFVARWWRFKLCSQLPPHLSHYCRVKRDVIIVTPLPDQTVILPNGTVEHIRNNPNFGDIFILNVATASNEITVAMETKTVTMVILTPEITNCYVAGQGDTTIKPDTVSRISVEFRLGDTVEYVLFEWLDDGLRNHTVELKRQDVSYVREFCQTRNDDRCGEVYKKEGELEVYLCDRNWTAVCSITTSHRQTTATTTTTPTTFSWWWVCSHGIEVVLLVGSSLCGYGALGVCSLRSLRPCLQATMDLPAPCSGYSPIRVFLVDDYTTTCIEVGYCCGRVRGIGQGHKGSENGDGEAGSGEQKDGIKCHYLCFI